MVTELHLGYYIAILLYLLDVDYSVWKLWPVYRCLKLVLHFETSACVQIFQTN